MRSLTICSVLLWITTLAASSAWAASYQRTDGVTVDPIRFNRMAGIFGPPPPHPYSGPDLEPFADLAGANLTDANLYSANLSSAVLILADLSSANLPFANLSGADSSGAGLRRAVLIGANLTNTDLAGANLSSAVLIGTDLTTADLTGANLSSAELAYANLTNADLTTANLSSADLSFVTALGSARGSASYDEFTDFTGTGFDPVAAGWTLVPEPSTALLLVLGLLGLGTRRHFRGRGAQG